VPIIMRVKNLNGDRPFDRELYRLVDDAKTTFPKNGDQAEFITKHLAKQYIVRMGFKGLLIDEYIAIVGTGGAFFGSKV
jgi:hypothetical protein